MERGVSPDSQAGSGRCLGAMSLVRRNLRAALKKSARHLSCFDRRWAQTPRQESGRRPRARAC
eukprot:1960613-Pyramimonas_sp.AAC.1